MKFSAWNVPCQGEGLWPLPVMPADLAEPESVIELAQL